jgi:hypothetical protein
MMAYIVCPECGAHNPPEEEYCRVCQAELIDLEPVEEPETPEEEKDTFDLFSSDEKDLPDLLQGLKEDDIEIDPEGLPDINLDAEADQPDFEGDPSGSGEGKEQTPEWLDLVRKRAQEEQDATGEMIRRISAAQEIVADGKDKSQHEDFESWLQELRDEARDQVAGGEEIPEEPDLVEPDEGVEKNEGWLTRIRKTHGTLEPRDEPDAAGRSLLDWLVALEEERSGEKPSETEEILGETQKIDLGETFHPDDATRKVKVSATPEEKSAALNLTREEREQADLLTAVITGEKIDHPVQPRNFKLGVRWANVFFLIVLVVSLSLALFVGGTEAFTWPQAAPEARDLLNWIRLLPEDTSLLFIFDYQPAYAGEIKLTAEPVLIEIVEKTSEITIASSSASGQLLSNVLFTDTVDSSTVKLTDIGYFPIESFGAYGIATGLTSAQSTSSLSMHMNALLAGQYDGIVILSDNSEGAQSWVEQLSSRAPELPLALLVTAQSVPLLQPYFDSGQVVGIAGGLQDGVTLALLTGQNDLIDHRWRAYQIGVFVLVGALVLGAVFSTPQISDFDTRGER